MSAKAVESEQELVQWKAAIEANRELGQRLVDAMNRGDSEAFLSCFADDVEYWMPGTTPLSGQRKGMKGWIAFQEEVNSHLAQLITVTVKNLISSEEWLVIEAQGRAVTRKGQDYNNSYCGLLQVRDGKVVKVHEYLDTELVSDVLCVG